MPSDSSASASSEVISENIRVYVRTRPADIEQTINDTSSARAKREDGSGVKDFSKESKTCTYYSAVNKINLKFAMDRFFHADSTQQDVSRKNNVAFHYAHWEQ